MHTHTIEAMKSDIITGLVAQDDGKNINVSYPEGWGTAQIQKIKIHNVSVTAELSTTGDMAFDINLFGKDTHEDTGLVTTAEDFMGMIRFVVGDSETIDTGGASFRYTKDFSDNPILYQDLDNSGELHITIVPRTATSFAAADSITITFMVEPIL